MLIILVLNGQRFHLQQDLEDDPIIDGSRVVLSGYVLGKVEEVEVRGFDNALLVN